MRFIAPNKYSFRLIYRKKKPAQPVSVAEAATIQELSDNVRDFDKRSFLKVMGLAGAGVVAASVFPKKADALVMGGTPATSVVGVRNASNTRINPATEEGIENLLTGQGVSKATTSIAASGTVLTPGSGKKLRIYSMRFSLTADVTSVGFRFTAGGSDFERYISPKTGGLYGANNHPNYIEGGVDQVLYCALSGSATLQINVDYLEV